MWQDFPLWLLANRRKFSDASVHDPWDVGGTMSTYDEFIVAVKDIHRLQALQGHLGWDRETIMPEKGAAARADMLSWLAKEAHGRLVSPQLGRMIDDLATLDTLDEDRRQTFEKCDEHITKR